MQMIPNTGIVVLNNLETAYLKVKESYDEFEQWFVAMSNSRGTVDPNREMDASTMADAVSYLSKRFTVAQAAPKLRRQVESLKSYLTTVRENFEGNAVDEHCRQILKVNYLVVKIFVHRTETLLARAEEQIERSAAVNPELRKALDMAIEQSDDPAVLDLLDKRIR